ncbi:MAG TPA: glycosyltransferase family 39 protein [Methylomirabilota bacterium]|nr:glycosyltransferase family 39 protein [Methylomirabilota bacterium]
MSDTRRDWAIVAGVYLALVVVVAVWLAIDRTPPEWDHANHLERAVNCAEDLAQGDVRRIIERSSFYPPIVPCGAALVYRLVPSDVASAQSVVLAFLGLGMAAVYLLGRRLAGATEGVVAAVVFGCAPFVVFSALRFQLDLPLAAMVALALFVVLQTDGFTRLGWSLAAGVVFGLGMLTKPPFAAYVIVPVLLVAASSDRRRRGAAYAALAILVGAALSVPWYGPRLFGLLPQITARSFKQAAESGHPDPLTATALLFYPTWLTPELGALAILLLLVGLGVAVVRRQWIAIATLLAPIVLFSLLQNKNLRYMLPVLPMAAVFAGMAFGLLPGRHARIVGAFVLALVCAIQVSATALGVPKGLTVPGLGVPLVLESPPRTGDWRHREILALIAKDSRGEPVTVSVVPNDNFFSVSNFRYYGTRDRLPLQFTRAWDGEPIGIEYMILKTGDVGPSWTAEKPKRIAERLRTDEPLARVFPVIGEFQLPDGSTATVRARRLTDAVSVQPAVLARDVQAAVRRALADFATDVQGLDITLGYDESLLRGHVGRIEIRAASARLGELKRPGSSLLRVGDVRMVFEDVLVNPFALHATGRLSPLDARRATIQQVTIREADLQAFLKEQKGFKTASVKLEPGALAFAIGLPGPDVAARVRVLPATDRPFALSAERVTVGGLPVPAFLVDWVVRTWDPTPRIASRLPLPVAVERIDITPEAIRISARP